MSQYLAICYRRPKPVVSVNALFMHGIVVYIRLSTQLSCTSSCDNNFVRIRLIHKCVRKMFAE